MDNDTDLEPTHIQLAFVWPCYGCRSLFEIDRVTFNQLESGQLVGIKCPTCLFPPPDSGLLRSAA